MAVIDGEWLSKAGLTYFWSKIKSIFTKQTETNAIANLGAKNLLKATSKTRTFNGVTFTVNDDQTITVNGTASATTTYTVIPNAQAISIPDGEYILSGCPSGGGTTTFDLRWYQYSSGKSAYDQGSGALVTKDGNAESSNIAIVIRSGVTTNNLVFKPMLRPAEITDGTFVPYAKTNVDLTNENEKQQLEIDYAINAGAKNMLYISNTPGHTATSHGRTFTVLSDGGIKITGTSSDNSNADFYVIGSWGNRSILLNENKDSCLIRMSCDTDYGYNQIRLRVMNRSTGSTVNDTGAGTNEDVRLSHVITTAFVSVFPSVTLPEDGIVVYPMIRRAEITDATFQPYAPSNRELYETRFASKTILPNNVDLNDIKTGGIYNGVNSTGNSAVHMPVATGNFNFVLTVIEANEFIIQIFKQLNSAGDPNLYIRRFYIYNSDWDSWYQFTGTQV